MKTAKKKLAKRYPSWSNRINYPISKSKAPKLRKISASYGQNIQTTLDTMIDEEFDRLIK